MCWGGFLLWFGVFYIVMFLCVVFYIVCAALLGAALWPRCCLGGVLGLTRLRDRMIVAVRGFVAGSAFVDPLAGESVCLVSESGVAGFLRERFGAVDWRVVELFTRGEVLSDPRGCGSLQRVEDDV